MSKGSQNLRRETRAPREGSVVWVEYSLHRETHQLSIYMKNHESRLFTAGEGNCKHRMRDMNSAVFELEMLLYVER